MSSKHKGSPKHSRTLDAEHKAVLAAYTKGAIGVVQAIKAGSVEEIEFEKLHNLILTGLVMIELVPLSVFRSAQRIAEMRSLFGGTSVYMDPEKINGTTRTEASEASQAETVGAGSATDD